MKYLLDTNICIYAIKNKPIEVIQKLKSLNLSEVGISSITVAELEYGVSKSQFREKNQNTLYKFLAPFEILPFGQEEAKIYGGIRSFLEKQGNVIGAMDLLIAAHSIKLNTILVTNNTKEFSRLPNLKLENWVK